MSITYPLILPASPGFKRFAMRARKIAGMVPSEFTAEQQVQEWQGEFWEADCSLPPMVRASAEAWTSFLLSLRGKTGTFLLGDPAGKTPRGVATGSPVVDVAGQTGTSLNTRGWTISQTGILKAGDYMQIGTGATTRLFKVLQDANSDGTGKATFDIFPRLRESPADAAAITVSSAKGTFRLGENVAEWDLDEVKNFGIGFKAMEAI